MPMLFEVFLEAATIPESLLSEETIQETGAKLLSPEAAVTAGLSGLPTGDPSKGVQYFVMVAAEHERWVQRQLDHHAGVRHYQAHSI